MIDRLRLHYAPDNASLCVRLALEALGRPYETVLVDRATGQQKSDPYLALNPNGLIPTLETGDGVIFETGAILLWLADQSPGRLFPAIDATERGNALTWLFWLSNTLHPCLLRIFYSDRYGEPEATKESAKAEFEKLLSLLDVRWDHIGSPLKACYLAPMLRWASIYGGRPGWFDLDKFHTLRALSKTFEKQEFVIRAAKAEGLGVTPFSHPILPNPPEGTAL